MSNEHKCCIFTRLYLFPSGKGVQGFLAKPLRLGWGSEDNQPQGFLKSLPTSPRWGKTRALFKTLKQDWV